MVKRKRIQPLNDGVVDFYKVTDKNTSGGMPDFELVKELSLNYKERIVGIRRFWTAYQTSAEIDMVIRCHRVNSITTHHVIKLRDNEQYDIRQIQYPTDVFPPVMDLSLERRADKYNIQKVTV